jgi:hypothetical protein
MGLQEKPGKIASRLATAATSGKFSLTQKQGEELRDGLADIPRCVALLCGETGMNLQDVATHSIAQIEARTKGLDPDQRQTIAGLSAGRFHVGKCFAGIP